MPESIRIVDFMRCLPCVFDGAEIGIDGAERHGDNIGPVSASSSCLRLFDDIEFAALIAERLSNSTRIDGDSWAFSSSSSSPWLAAAQGLWFSNEGICASVLFAITASAFKKIVDIRATSSSVAFALYTLYLTFMCGSHVSKEKAVDALQTISCKLRGMAGFLICMRDHNDGNDDKNRMKRKRMPNEATLDSTSGDTNVRFLLNDGATSANKKRFIKESTDKENVDNASSLKGNNPIGEHFKFPLCQWYAISSPASDDPVAVKARRIMCIKIYMVYIELCSLSSFCSRNVFETGSSEFVFNPIIDSMGVCSSACEILRTIYAGDEAEIAFDELQYLHLTLECRVNMAAALFLSYKLKTEDSWSDRSGIAKFVLSKFVSASEFSSQRSFANMSSLMTNTELNLINYLNIHTISEFNIFHLVEYKMEYLLGEKLVTPLASAMAMSVASFYIYFYRCVTHTEMLELLAKSLGIETVVLALVVISIASLASSFTVDVHNLPKAHRIGFDENSMRTAKTILEARVACNQTTIHGFPSLCSIAVAQKALTQVNASIQAWTEVVDLSDSVLAAA